MKDANKTFLIALLLALFIGNITMQAQDPLQVSGTVVSKTDGEPIIGATIVETENNTNGTISDFEGKFYLSVKPRFLGSFTTRAGTTRSQNNYANSMYHSIKRRYIIGK